MKKLLGALIVGTFAFVHGPALAQDKKTELNKADTAAKKDDGKKQEGKKKIKKGGC